MNAYFIAGIGTNVGKTFISAILTAGLNAYYWKPVQAGLLPETDFNYVKNALSLDEDRVLPPAYLLKKPESPHSAADAEGIRINLTSLPQVEGNLIVEGAGGILVPLCQVPKPLLYVDQIQYWRIPVIIVIDGYLGAINHTLLTIEALKIRNIPIYGLIFNRMEFSSARDFIIQYTGLPVLGDVPLCQPQNNDDFVKYFNLYINFK